MLIFALGLYELFINKVYAVERSELAARLLLIRSFDNLKDRLAKLIMLILVVGCFALAIRLPYQTPLDLLYLALVIALVGWALSLRGAPKLGKGELEPPKPIAAAEPKTAAGHVAERAGSPGG